MTIDREALRKQLNQRKEQRAAGNVEYIKKDTTRNLRILEFTTPDGTVHFARTVVQHRLKADTKKTIIDRQKTLGLPCACARLNALCSEKGTDSPFARAQTIYYINAIDVDQTPHKVKIFQIPSSVWETIAEMLVSDEWKDVLDPQNGHTFAITRQGEGLDTEYPTIVGRKPWPVNETLLKQVVDPITAVVDPGIQGQCDALGIQPTDLWSDYDQMADVEPVDTKKLAGGTKKSTPAKSEPKAAPKGPSANKPKKAAFAVGQRVEAQFDDGNWYLGEVSSDEGDGSFGVQFDDGDSGTYPASKIRAEEGAAEPEAPSEEPESLVGVAGTGVFPDDGEKYACTVVEHYQDRNLLKVEWADGTPASVITVDEFEVDDIPFEEAPAVNTEDIPVPRRSGTTAGKAVSKYTG